MKKIFVLLLCLGLVGCGTNSGVIKIGEDAYKINRRAGSGFQGTTELRKLLCLKQVNFV